MVRPGGHERRKMHLLADARVVGERSGDPVGRTGFSLKRATAAHQYMPRGSLPDRPKDRTRRAAPTVRLVVGGLANRWTPCARHRAGRRIFPSASGPPKRMSPATLFSSTHDRLPAGINSAAVMQRITPSLRNSPLGKKLFTESDFPTLRLHLSCMVGHGFTLSSGATDADGR